MEFLYPLFISFILVFISELGDKTQLIALYFSSKLKFYVIILGVALGSFFSHGIAILFGSFLGNIDNPAFQSILKIITYISFIIFGIVTIKQRNSTESVSSRDNTKIKKNQYNIPEPIDGIEVPSNKIDVVFVPLLAFDKKGHRVGYGKGFYDKFLSECKPDVIKIGLSFFEPEELITDVFEGDVKLDYCVTSNEVYFFSFA